MESDPLLTIHRITLELTRTYNSGMLLEKIIDACIKISDSKTGTLMLVNPDDQVLEIQVQRGFTDRITREVRLKVGEGLTGMVALTGKPFLANNVDEVEFYVPIKKNIKSELAVPMEVDGRVFGVISLDSPRVNHFTEEQLKFVQILASQAAQVFSNVRQFEQLDKQNKIQQALIDIARLLGSGSDFKKIFHEMMRILEDDLKLRRGMILLFSEQSGQLELIEGSDLTDAEKRKASYAPGEGVIGRVFSSAEPFHVKDMAADTSMVHKTGKKKGPVTSFFCQPIITEGEPDGVFALEKEFTSDEEFKVLTRFVEILTTNISQVLKIDQLVKDAQRKLEMENVILKREVAQKYVFQNIIGRSSKMEHLFKMIHTIADTRANVLITGENGTGKELVASAIHYNSTRKDEPLIKINCASIPEYLLESELFGHRKGSFTGAVSDKKGKFEIAHGGSIFLDEIGDMDLGLQAKLLRVIQERQIEPIGALRSTKIDVRIIAATNRDLEEMVAEKKFREDLYYRLNVIRLEIPPLRERISDIPVLCTFFVEKYAQINDKQIHGISRDALKKLQDYAWPGNVRELENMIERAVILCDSEVLGTEDFDLQERVGEMNPTGNTMAPPARPAAPQNALGFSDKLEHIFRNNDGNVYEKVIKEVERILIANSLKKFRYVKTKTAQFLGINRNTLDKKIRELDIDY